MSNFRTPEVTAFSTLREPSVKKVFDFDGTLFRTGHIHAESSKLTFADLDSDIIISPELVTSFRGKSDEQIFAMIFGDDQGMIRAAIEARTAHLIHLARNLDSPDSILLPGVDNVIRTLRRTGQKAGIASASPDDFVLEILGKTEVDGQMIIDVFPEAKICGSSTIRRVSPDLAKPSPFSLLQAADGGLQMSTAPLQYIGDSRVDAQSVINFPGDATGIIASPDYQTLRTEFDGYGNIIFVQTLGHIATRP